MQLVATTLKKTKHFAHNGCITEIFNIFLQLPQPVTSEQHHSLSAFRMVDHKPSVVLHRLVLAILNRVLAINHHNLRTTIT